MIVSWNWLKQYVALDMSVDELIDRLMMSGINHEGTEEVEGDFVIDLEVTSNRPDCLGHLGIAREVAVLFSRDFQMPAIEFKESEHSASGKIGVEIAPEASAWCPQYRARVIEGVKVGPSPDWMQRRLRAVGLAPISNVVDITNYVLLECGQPLHAFDYDKIAGKRIVVRNARQGEKFLAINNKEYTLQPWMPVIADGARAVALAGIMGGAETEVSNATNNVLLETAEFTPLEIRRASRALDLSSDSSYRFERKIDPAGVAWASERACHLLCELAGGKVAKGFVHAGKTDHARPPITMRWSRIARILGIDVSPAVAQDYLRRLGMQVVSSDDQRLQAVPPTFRRDITREIDLVEEVGRVHGYESVSEERLIPMAVARPGKSDRVVDTVRDTLCQSGYFEAVTFSFVDAKSAETVRPWTNDAPLTVQHSSRKQENCLRQSLLPSLLHALGLNESRGNVDVALYEVAQVFLPRPNQVLPDEPLAAGLVTNVGMRGGLSSDTLLRQPRGHLEALFHRLHLHADFQQLPPDQVPAGFDPVRAAEVVVAGIRVGLFGFASDAARQAFDLRADVVMAELLVRSLVEHARPMPKLEPIPDQPASVRDLAIVLDEGVRWSDLEQVAREVAPAADVGLERLEFVDLYRGKQVQPGKKSIAFRLTYRAPGRTLTREEVDARQQAVVDAIAARLGGALRA